MLRRSGRASSTSTSTSASTSSSMGVKSQECHICLEDLRQDLMACPCGHVFHQPCILQALQVNAQCPICRRHAAESDLVYLYFDVPDGGSGESPQKEYDQDQNLLLKTGTAREEDTQVLHLTARVTALMERLQWQKKQSDLLVAEMKRVRNQSEQLMLDKQTLLQRVTALEANKSELVNKVAKYQMELSRQAEATRQMAVNQSLVNYLNTCDADAIEEEIQNPRELIMALKKACKFRHDQYQKVVKEKMRLKAMLQQTMNNGAAGGQERVGKGKLKAAVENKRQYPMEYGHALYPLETKKRKAEHLGHTPTPMGHSTSLLPFNPSSAPLNVGIRTDSAGFCPNAYSDVSVRPVATARPTFTRSNYNPNQYGAYNLTPATEAPVQVSNQGFCRRGYDETGKLTNFFLPKDSKCTPSSTGFQRQKPIPGVQDLLATHRIAAPVNTGAVVGPRTAGGDRREYGLTSWLRSDS